MATAQPTAGRWLRALLYAVFGIGILVALILLGLATPPGRAALASFVERAALANGITVTIGRLSGWPPFDFGADRVVVADADGPYAEIENLSAELRTSALLRGSVAFSTMASDRVALARQPHLPPTPPGDETFPFAVDRFTVGRLELGPALAGRAAVLAASGAFASAANGSIVATVNGERSDGTLGKLEVSIRRANRASPLAVDVALEEAADGILVGLLGRSDGPGYRLAARTEVNGDAVAGTLTLASTGTAHAAGRFTLSPVGGARRLELTGAGELAELAPADYVDLLSGPIAIAIDADWTAASGGQALPRVVIRKATLRTATVAADASGALNDAAANLALKVTMTKPGGGPITLPAAQARLDSAALSGTVTRAGDSLKLELAGRIANL